MKPILAALSVVLALILVSPVPSGAISPSKVAKSVTTLNVLDSGVYRPICTVSSINEDDRHWLTAAHCVDHPDQTYIFEDPVLIVELDAKHDVAILQTALVNLPALKLAGKAPKMGDEIMMVGHQGPLMMHGPTVTRGWIMHPNLITSDEPGWDMPFMVFQMVAATGNSGSAVVNKKDQIVSVLQWGYGRHFSAVSGGAIYENVAKYKQYFD